MKKTVYFLLLLFLAGTTFCQAPMTDGKTQLSWVSKHSVKITNLQSCSVDYLVKVPSDSLFLDTVWSVPPGGSYIKEFDRSCGQFRAIPMANCDASLCGKVGINTCSDVLPVGVSFEWHESSDKQYIEGEIKNVKPGKSYKVKITLSDHSVIYKDVPLTNKVGDTYTYKIPIN